MVFPAAVLVLWWSHSIDPTDYFLAGETQTPGRASLPVLDWRIGVVLIAHFLAPLLVGVTKQLRWDELLPHVLLSTWLGSLVFVEASFVWQAVHAPEGAVGDLLIGLLIAGPIMATFLGVLLVPASLLGAVLGLSIGARLFGVDPDGEGMGIGSDDRLL